MLRAWAIAACFVACGTPVTSSDEGPADAGAPSEFTATPEPARDPARPHDSDAGVPPVSDWPRYVIEPGAHSATVVRAAAGNPLAGLVDGIGARTYDLAFDASAIYAITAPAQPNDQLDWNKLPGLSDCGTFDLSVDGVMFGWRWRLDVTPNVLEVTAYANGAGVHRTATTPMVVLDAADLESASPLHYRLWMDGADYRFVISGSLRGRTISATSALARRCASTAPSSVMVQWAAGLYFGGTSPAPTTITARVFEL